MPERRSVASHPPWEPSTEAATVFLVDGDEAVRDAVASALRAAGFQVGTFDSAEQFLEADRSDGRSCLVVDLDLPGMGGIALLKALDVAGLALPAVITSRRLRPEGRGGAGAPAPLPAPLLEKPFGVDDLLPLIQGALARMTGSAWP
jgi:DNA-binding NtrC family response regulator